MAALEAPRLTSALRARGWHAHTSAGSTASAATAAHGSPRVEHISALIARRNALLSELGISTHAAPGGKSASSSSSSQSLEWPLFAGPFTHSGEAHVKDVKKAFLKFMSMTAEALGSEGSTDDVHAAAHALYCASVSRLAASTPEITRALAHTLGSAVNAATAGELQRLASKMHEWRMSHGVSTPITDAADAGSAAPASTPPASMRGFTPLRHGQSAFWEEITPMYRALTPLEHVAAQATAEPKRSAPAAVAAAPPPAAASAAPAASGGPLAFDALWLWAQCSQYLAQSGMDTYTPEALGVELIRLFHDHRSAAFDASEDSRLQNELFGLLGEGGIEFMTQLTEHRRDILGITQTEYKRVASAIAASMDGVTVMGRARGTARRAGIGPSVMVMSAADIAASKAQQKANRLAGKHAKTLEEIHARVAAGDTSIAGALLAAGFDPEEIAMESTLGLASDRGATARTTAAGRDGSGLLSVEDAIASVGAGFGGAPKRLLPEGTVEVTKEGYREVSIPPPKLVGSAIGDASRLVAVDTLHPIAQSAFKGIKRLNRLQSELFHAAYESNENILVCAPTGAGKTNVAMLTVCRELLSHVSDDGRLRRDEFKIVYVAPMKALAQEVVAKFSERLSGLGLSVRELTGDMQLTKKEIAETQVIVTTPEKWDVITRKAGDGSLVALVKLLIIDEVHLLADERGAVIESIVARTLRMVETTQSVIRIVGLSATLPNYKDVGSFLRVNPETGLFYFNDAYRPVPLQQTFIGVTEQHPLRRANMMNQIAYQKAVAAIRRGKQVMVFVHSRKDTGKTARALRDIAQTDGTLRLLSPFSGEEAEDTDAARLAAAGRGTSAIQGEGRVSLSNAQWLAMQREVDKSRNQELRELFPNGFGIHHAGMLRSDRLLTERMFAAGVIKILVCTATLAWGVNLPAHTVIIKGTQIYDAEAGGFADLGMLDVMQIFGRAGRPQFDTSGEGIIITAHDKLQHYLHLLLHALPIESSFIKALPDHLNAEIVSGTVTNVREAVSWLSYTYLYVRMLRNPLAYGIGMEEFLNDPDLHHKRIAIIVNAAKTLDGCRMIRFDDHSTNFAVTDLGRVASHYYIHNSSIDTFNQVMAKARVMSDADVIDLVTRAEEFKNIKVRDEELPELDFLRGTAHIKLKGDVANASAKTNVLLQAFISRAELRSFTLISDMAYINQSAGRIARALFEIYLRKGWCTLAERLLTLSKCIDKRLWWDASPLWQFQGPSLRDDIIRKLHDSGMSLAELCDMSNSDLGALVRIPEAGARIQSALRTMPFLDVEASVQPITRGILRVTAKLYASFNWSDRIHGSVEPFWLWVEDGENDQIYHSEYVLLAKRQALSSEPVTLTFSIPIFEPLPAQYWIRIMSDRWLGVETMVPLSFKHLILPDKHAGHTNLLDLAPLPVAALHNPAYEALYTRFTHFNPIQTQVFHTLYHTDESVLLGAPTGSGKTIAAELALFRLWNAHPGAKAVYIAPLKALVSERMKDWKAKLEGRLGRTVVELTGDFTPDIMALKRADVIVTTPEKWDGISRSWQRRDYVRAVGVIIIDEIHLLGEDRGPVLEVIVSRMRYIAERSERKMRFIGLSTALANAGDLADWLGIGKTGLFNFRPSVRPIPMTTHLQGFPGKHYCPRMASMNKPAYAAITTYSPEQPVLIFVSSRRQTRLTAMELIALCAHDEHPRRFLRMPEAEMDALLPRVRDSSLRHALEFGIGLHHAGLPESDRALVEELFVQIKIQVLVCTSTLAWGVNFPAHLVIVKGTEYFDAKTSRYVDYPITDVLQMMGRAGRPQFDTQGVAVILVHEPKKNFYKKFLYEPFPVESHLRSQLSDHINAEIVGGTIRCTADALEYLSWTYFFRRLLQNPNYYGLEDASAEGVRVFLTDLVHEIFGELEESGCVYRGDDAAEVLVEESHGLPTAMDGDTSTLVAPSSLGFITSFYYLHHATARMFVSRLQPACSVQAAARILCDASEFDELPVRHNEEELNEALATRVPWPVGAGAFNDPHVKAYLLLQARFCRAPLPITDYVNDTKSVMDQTLRVGNAMVDVAADAGFATTALSIMRLLQCVVQARMPEDPVIRQLPHVDAAVAQEILATAGKSVELREWMQLGDAALRHVLERARGWKPEYFPDVFRALRRLPQVNTRWSVIGKGAASSGTARLPEGTDGAPDIEVPANVELEAVIQLRTTNFIRGDTKAYAPLYAKQKEWSWWLVVVDTATDELLAMKRIPHPEAATHVLSLPEMDADRRAGLALHLVSDSIAGLDQRLDLQVRTRASCK